MKRGGYRGLYLLPIVLVVSAVAGCRSEADRVTGTWQGTLDLAQVAPQRVKRGTTLRVVCHIQKGSDGKLTGTLDSPDQGATGLAIDTVTLEKGAFHLQLNRLFASYDGKLARDGRTIAGQWQQGPVTMPLTFVKSE